MAKSTPSPIVAYDPSFLGGGLSVPLPTLRGRALEHSLEQGRVFDFTYYSVAMNRERKLAIYSAANVDGARWVSLKRPSGWSYDERIGIQNQLDERFYSKTWTRGHLTRRNDLCWGPQPLASWANHNSFFLANAAPQHSNFNGDEWGELEDWFLSNAKASKSRAIVITGPVFRTDDPTFTSDGITSQVPAGFWKIIAIEDPAALGVDLTASAFLMRQTEMWGDATGARLNLLQRYQVPVALVERLTCLDFGALRTVDPLGWRLDRSSAGEVHPRPIKALDDIVISSAERRRNTRYPRLPSGGCGCAGEPASRGDQGGAVETRVERLERLVASLAEQVNAGAVDASNPRALSLARGVQRILGGTAVPDTSFADCVYVDASPFLCTGVLIGSNVVVTAAHCCFDEHGRRIKIRRVFVGNNVSDPDAGTEWIDVAYHAPHPDYSPGGNDRDPSNDIAVLVLARPATAATPVAVASAQEAKANAAEVHLVGFGTTNRNASAGAGIKRQVDLPISHLWADASDDRLKFDAERLGFHLLTEFTAIDPSMKKDTCPGDSGGPAYISLNGAWAVLGLTSRGFESSRFACSEGGIYTLVAPFLPWLRQEAGAHGGLLGSPGGGPPTPPPAPPPSTPPDPDDAACC